MTTLFLKNIDQKKVRLDAYRPFPQGIIKNLGEWFRIETTATSNALEGNTLTSSETAMVVEKGLTIGGKTVQEHLEAINHAHAFDYMVSLAKKNKSELTLREILSIHKLVLSNIHDEHAGVLRKIAVKISGSSVKLTDPIHVPDEMESFMKWLTTTTDHPVLIAAQAHLKLVTIHPFFDGNGRTARLLMNLLLMQAGYPPAIISPTIRPEYIASLEVSQLQNNDDRFNTLILKAVEESLDIYLEHLEKSI